MGIPEIKVEDYLHNVDRYLKGDFRNFEELCDKLEQNNPGSPDDHSTSGHSGGTVIYRSTLPHALLLFSAIDLVGYLLGSTVPGPGGTETHFKDFFNYTSATLQPLDQKEISALVHLIRHGAAHGYFPKLDIMINYHSALANRGIFFKENGNICFNVKQFSVYFFDCWENILNKMNNNASFLGDMQGQYDNMNTADQKSKYTNIYNDLSFYIDSKGNP